MTERLAEFEKALDYFAVLVRLDVSTDTGDDLHEARKALLQMYRDSQATVEHYHGRTVELENFCPWCKRIDGGHQAECREIQRRVMEDESLRAWVWRVEDALLELGRIFHGAWSGPGHDTLLELRKRRGGRK